MEAAWREIALGRTRSTDAVEPERPASEDIDLLTPSRTRRDA